MEGRYELKFLITYDQKQRFLREAGERLQPDPHGENGRYRITSQYYDAPDYTCYWAKLDGVGVRKKIRTRYYGLPQSINDVTSQSMFLEIKHRRGACVFKERVKVSGDIGYRLLEKPSLLSRLTDEVAVSDRSGATVNKIERLAQKSELHATNVISYTRDAWLGMFDHRLRITFDSDTEAFAPNCFLPVPGCGLPLLSNTHCILEIKFDRVIPTWVRECVICTGVQLQRFSKYAHGVEALHLEKSLPAPAIQTDKPKTDLTPKNLVSGVASLRVPTTSASASERQEVLQ